MSDRPILFSAPMIRALLAGRKTQTRRIIKSARVFATPERPAWTLRGDDLARALQGADRFRRMDGDGWFWEADAFEWQRPATRTGWLAHIGYAPGDRLWGREAWRAASQFDRVKPRDIPAQSVIAYEAGGDDIRLGGKLRPSMFMPRWASRITLIVSDVRVQRLQEISEEDAISEGMWSYETLECDGDPRLDGAPYRSTFWHWRKDIEEGDGYSTAASAYRHLWADINGPGSWEANPWIAAYTFEPIMKNIDALPAVEIANSDEPG